MTVEVQIFTEMKDFKTWTEYYRSKNIMPSSLLTKPVGHEWSDRRTYNSSPTITRRLLGNSSPRTSPRCSPTTFDRIDDSSEEKTSSDERESRVQKLDEERKPRTSSIISFSNVKRKISTTFHRRHSHTNLPAAAPASPVLNQRKSKTRRASTSTTNLPSLSRQTSLDESPSSKQRSPLRRSSTVGHSLGAIKPIHPDHATAHPLWNRLRNNIMHMDPFATSSTPDIQSRSRANSTQSIKKFKVYLLGSRAVGKTALTVRFLTGRYIHEYKSSPEEVYNRIMKYEDEQADVTIYTNDIENMEEDIELDQDSGLMILYSIVDKSSYQKAKILLEHLRDLSILGQFPVVLIGTKRDLSRLRKVKREIAFDTANSFNCTHFDVSAASDRKVKDCFHTLFRQIEIRQLLHSDDEKKVGIHTILNPPKSLRHGTYRYGTC